MRLTYHPPAFTAPAGAAGAIVVLGGTGIVAASSVKIDPVSGALFFTPNGTIDVGDVAGAGRPRDVNVDRTLRVDFVGGNGIVQANTTDPAASGFLRMGNNAVIAWRNAASTGDILLGPNVSDQLLIANLLVTTNGAAGVTKGLSLQSQVNQAGAGGGTLTNAPAAGNPTFWLPVNINGALKKIPCW